MSARTTSPDAELYALVYAELHRRARALRGGERDGHTLQPTALIHEVYLKLRNDTRLAEQDRHAFLSAASRAMRCILVDHARRKRAAKRGGALRRSDLSQLDPQAPQSDDQLIALDDGLKALASFDEQLSHLVELRFFAGCTVDETAGVLGLAPITVKRRWKIAKTWLFGHIAERE